jgi:hypothetical protein
MSHFTVLVVTDEPGKEAIAEILQPYHEFECTGTDDEYVQDLDITEEAGQEYDTHNCLRLVDHEGTLHTPYSDRFFREPTAEEKEADRFRDKVRFVPEGWTEKRMLTKELKSFRDFCTDYYGIKFIVEGDEPDLDSNERHKYGYGIVNSAGEVLKVINRTNPNKKWDWWELGGRWTGDLISRGPSLTGKPGLMTDPAKPGTCDQCHIGDLDLEAMKAKNQEERNQWWKEAEGLKPEERDWRFGIKPEMTEEEYVNNCSALQTFAILDETGWHEKGEMGWWGCVSNEKDDWPQLFQAYLAEIMKKPEKYIAIVDCHI